MELPTVFATSNAELFAKGAVKLLASIPSVKTLCFGAENAEKTAFKLAARYLNDEPKEVSEKIKEAVENGVSYAKARARGYAGYIPLDLLCSPNNILGLEYTRAIESMQTEVDIFPIERKGAGYADEELKTNYSSASAIRAAIENGDQVDGNLPDFVLNDLPTTLRSRSDLETLEKYAILSRTAEEISRVCDCTEGLENALKRVAGTNEPLVESLTSARYTSSRIRRIALQNLLGIDKSLILNGLQSALYLRVLAVKKERSDLLSALSESAFPLIIRAHNEDVLQGVAKECFEKDKFAEKVYSLLYPTKQKENNIFL